MNIMSEEINPDNKNIGPQEEKKSGEKNSIDNIIAVSNT